MNADRKHEWIQTAGQLYSCGSCQKSFPTERQLFGHLRVHDNVLARYTCDVCNKPFKLAKELRRHRRVHTGEKPYSCSYCDKRFSAASNLRCARCYTFSARFGL